MLPKCNTTAPMLINYQMLAVEMCRQSSLVVALSIPQVLISSLLRQVKIREFSSEFSSVLHCCFSLAQQRTVDNFIKKDRK